MIFIPFGVKENDQNRYELTQYINDVTTQNTQVLMEYSNESGITAYTYGNERLSYETNGVNYKYNYDGRGSVTNLLDNTGASVVEGTIRSTIPIPGNSIDTFIHETADLKVIVNSLGKVISVYPK